MARISHVEPAGFVEIICVFDITKLPINGLKTLTSVSMAPLSQSNKVLFISPSQVGLGYFLGDSWDKRETKHNNPCFQGEIMCLKDGLQERHVDHQQEQENGQCYGILHITIRKDADLENGQPF